jgi:hypothetical protein
VRPNAPVSREVGLVVHREKQLLLTGYEFAGKGSISSMVFIFEYGLKDRQLCPTESGKKTHQEKRHELW